MRRDKSRQHKALLGSDHLPPVVLMRSNNGKPTSQSPALQSAYERVLNPDCLDAIFGHVHDTKSLARLMRVSKGFYNVAAKHLYRRVWAPCKSTVGPFIDYGRKCQLLEFTQEMVLYTHLRAKCKEYVDPEDPLEGSFCKPALSRLKQLTIIVDKGKCFGQCSSLAKARPEVLHIVDPEWSYNHPYQVRPEPRQLDLPDPLISRVTTVHYQLGGCLRLAQAVTNPVGPAVTRITYTMAVILPIQSITSRSDLLRDAARGFAQLQEHVARHGSGVDHTLVVVGLEPFTVDQDASSTYWDWPKLVAVFKELWAERMGRLSDELRARVSLKMERDSDDEFGGWKSEGWGEAGCRCSVCSHEPWWSWRVLRQCSPPVKTTFPKTKGKKSNKK